MFHFWAIQYGVLGKGEEKGVKLSSSLTDTRGLYEYVTCVRVHLSVTSFYFC